MNTLCERLGVQLQRWLGAGGWQALLARSVAVAAPTAPRPLVVAAGGELHWSGPASDALARAACVEVLVAMASALARFIGVDLARQVMARAFAAGSIEGSDHE